jgi:hypothetical protein
MEKDQATEAFNNCPIGISFPQMRKERGGFFDFCRVPQEGNALGLMQDASRAFCH